MSQVTPGPREERTAETRSPAGRPPDGRTRGGRMRESAFDTPQGDDWDSYPGQRTAARPLKRLMLGQTAVDFWGRRMRAFAISLILIAISAASLSLRWFNLGIEFEGGVVYDVPAGAEFGVDEARAGIDEVGVGGARVEERRSVSGDIIKVQVEDQPDEVRDELLAALAVAAGVDASEISVSSVSASWGDEITRKAATALLVFIGLVVIVISIRFEWRMAVGAIAAMLHDVVIAAGIYSVFGFEVTPATVVAFLTILGYSLYDTVVVFDRARENEPRIAGARLNAADLVNVSTNQVLMRTINTSVSAVLPVLALLTIAAGLLGQATLSEFALALLIGMVCGAYSTIFIAMPILGWLKGGEGTAANPQWLLGDDLRRIVVRGVGVLTPKASKKRARPAEPSAAPGATAAALEATTDQLLSHPPRPRKKKRH